MKQRGHVIETGSEQYQMVYALLCGTNRATAVVGVAGSGKSTGAEMYSLALEAGYLAERDGYLGPTIPSNDPSWSVTTLWAWLSPPPPPKIWKKRGYPLLLLCHGVVAIGSGTLVLEPGGTVIIDESSQASTDQL